MLRRSRGLSTPRKKAYALQQTSLSILVRKGIAARLWKDQIDHKAYSEVDVPAIDRLSWAAVTFFISQIARAASRFTISLLWRSHTSRISNICFWTLWYTFSCEAGQIRRKAYFGSSSMTLAEYLISIQRAMGFFKTVPEPDLPPPSC
jgi:hypothetical protein